MPRNDITDKQLIENFRQRLWAVMRFREVRQTHLEQATDLGRGVMSHFLQARFEGTRLSMLFVIKVWRGLKELGVLVDLGWLISGEPPMPHRTYPQLKLEPVPQNLPRGPSSDDYLKGWIAANTSRSDPMPAKGERAPKAKRKKRKKKHR